VDVQVVDLFLIDEEGTREGEVRGQEAGGQEVEQGGFAAAGWADDSGEGVRGKDARIVV
jgi:hypothetical protein